MDVHPHCELCKIYFSSKNSLGNHNRKFHRSESVIQSKNNQKAIKIQSKNNQKISLCDVTKNGEEIPNILACKHCNKILSHRNNTLRHEKNCKNRDFIKEKTEKLRLEKEELKIELLKKKLQSSDKIETVTLNKLNKLLLERHNRIKNSTVNSHNNIQNITNNYQIIGFGKEENIAGLLTNKEKLMILNARYSSLQKLIDIIHCGTYNQFKNIIITNIKDNYMYKYDEGKGIFVLAEKSNILNALINYRLDDLEVIYNEFVSQNKVDQKTKKCIEDFINKINQEENSDRQFEINEIKMLLFNNKDKITNDISLLLTVNEVIRVPPAAALPAGAAGP